MANLTVTQEQLDACTRHLDEQGKPYYTVQSASDPDGVYTVRWNAAYKVPQDNCKAGRRGEPCWHKRASMAAEAQFQTAQRVERDADLEDALASRSSEEVSEQAAIARYVNQGIDRATAERVVYAPPAELGPKGHMGCNAFSILK